MKNELDVVRKVSVRLDRADVAYMLTGSMAPGSRARKTSSSRSSYALGIAFRNCSFANVRNLITSECDPGYIERWAGELGVNELGRECLP